MKNFYQGGDVLCPLPMETGLSYKPPRGKIFSRTLLLACCTCLLLFVLPEAGAQFIEGEIKPLQVGDTIPEELWDMPLQVVNHPEGKDTITLNDYRDKKLIILDFWATWCGSCISAFPKVKSIEKRFEKDLSVIPVTSQSHEKISAFLVTNETIKPLNIWSAVNTGQLEQYFKIFTLPHYVWISNGRVASFTTVKAFEKKAVSSFLANGEPSWDEKVELDKKSPFASSLKEMDFSIASFYHKGSLEGVGRSRGILPYRNRHINYYFTNYTQQEVIEWFVRKVCEEHPEKYSEIKISSDISNLSDSENNLDSPISFQIIAYDNVNIEEIFHHWLILGGLEMKDTGKGCYEIFPKKEIKRKEKI